MPLFPCTKATAVVAKPDIDAKGDNIVYKELGQLMSGDILQIHVVLQLPNWYYCTVSKIDWAKAIQ